MGKRSPRLNDFRSGEMTPGLGARSDLDAYSRGCLVMKNCMPLIEGGVERVPGTRFLRTVKQTEEGWSLRITRSGDGSGDVDSDPPGIDCGPTCYTFFADGASIELTAEADAGSSFVGWSGDGTGSPVRTVVMNGNKAVDANFKLGLLGIYQYPVNANAKNFLRILSLNNYEIIKDIELIDTYCIPASAVGVVRLNDNGREEPFIDGNSNIYLMSRGLTGAPYDVRVIRFNIIDESLSYLSIPINDNETGFMDGYVYSNHIYFIRVAAMDGPKIHVIDLNSFTQSASYGAGNLQPGRPGILVSPEDDRIYCLDYRYEPYYSRVVSWKLSDGSYIKTTNIAAGAPITGQKAGFVRDGNYVYFLSDASTTNGSGNGRLCRFSLPGIDNVYSIVLPSGQGLHMCVNSAMTEAYVVSSTHIYKYSLPDFEFLNSKELGGTFNEQTLSMCLDELANRLYLSLYGSPDTFRSYIASSLELETTKSSLFSNSMFVVR